MLPIPREQGHVTQFSGNKCASQKMLVAKRRPDKPWLEHVPDGTQRGEENEKSGRSYVRPTEEWVLAANPRHS